MPWKKSEPMEERIEFGLRAVRTLNFRALCQEYGISAKTGYKWKERFLREGIRGMEEQSRRPQGHAKQLAEEEVCEIMRLKLAHAAVGAAPAERSNSKARASFLAVPWPVGALDSNRSQAIDWK